MMKETKPEETKPQQFEVGNEKALEEGELQDEELDTVNGGGSNLPTTTVSNLANMRHEMLKAVANNLRS